MSTTTWLLIIWGIGWLFNFSIFMLVLPRHKKEITSPMWFMVTGLFLVSGLSWLIWIGAIIHDLFVWVRVRYLTWRTRRAFRKLIKHIRASLQ